MLFNLIKALFLIYLCQAILSLSFKQITSEQFKRLIISNIEETFRSRFKMPQVSVNLIKLIYKSTISGPKTSILLVQMQMSIPLTHLLIKLEGLMLFQLFVVQLSKKDQPLPQPRSLRRDLASCSHGVLKKTNRSQTRLSRLETHKALCPTCKKETLSADFWDSKVINNPTI